MESSDESSEHEEKLEEDVPDDSVAPADAKGPPPLQTCMGPVEYYRADPENIPNHPAILAAGKRRTGKSTSLDNLMFETMRHIPFGLVMSDTAANGFWQRRVPERWVFQGWRPDILEALVRRQSRLVKKYGEDDPRTFAFIIFDDGKFSFFSTHATVPP